MGARTVSVMAMAGALLAYPGARADAQQVRYVLVTADSAAVRVQPDLASAQVGSLAAGTTLAFTDGDCLGPVVWCHVFAWPSEAELRGWVRKSDYYRSPGIVQVLFQRYDAASTGIAAEIRATSNPIVASWLGFYLAFAQVESRQFDQAIATLEGLTLSAAPKAWIPNAHLTEAKLYLTHDDVRAALETYGRLLAAYPGYRVEAADCKGSAAVVDAEMVCSGDPDIVARIAASKLFVDRQATAERIIAAPATPGPRKAAVRLDLCHALADKDLIDPVKHSNEAGQYRDDARRCYELVVHDGPGSDAAGDAAWVLIGLSGAYEWEGDWQGRAKWAQDQFGSFVSAYPRHAHAADAALELANAEWAIAGYPEVYGYIFTPNDWGEWRVRQGELDQWFVTGGFGGGRGDPVVQHPEQTRRARQMFLDLARTYPRSASAAMAQYNAAVILDYCLHDGRNAVVEYEAFVRDHADLTAYVERARKRIAALRGGSELSSRIAWRAWRDDTRASV